MTLISIHDGALIPLAGLLFLFIWKYAKYRASHSLPLPPGPKSLPIIGNALDFPKEKQWETYRRFSQIYGDVLHLNVLGQSIIVLGSAEAAAELLDKRSAIYSNRGQSVMASLTGWTWLVGALPYGQQWRRMRQILHRYFGQGAIGSHRSVHLSETRRLLRSFLNDQDQFVRHIRFAFGAIMMRIAYGIELADGDHTYPDIADKAMASFSQAFMPGAFLVESIPVLQYVPRWFPGASFRRKAVLWSADAKALRHVLFANVQQLFNSGATKIYPSITSELLDKASRLSYDEAAEEKALARDTMASAYAAGADTTFSTIQWLLLAMALYPEVQKKAQAELDAVVGLRRLPDFNDRNSLPYINAVMLECLRWQPVGPLGLIHSCLEDDEYKGYHIPKGALIIPNIWAYTRDPNMYPEPEKFNPERFLKSGKLDPDAKDPRTFVFGFGRRICPGRHMADSSLFILTASVLCTFDISAPCDHTGNPVSLKPEMTSGIIGYPAPFQLSLKPRSPSAEALIRSSEDS